MFIASLVVVLLPLGDVSPGYLDAVGKAISDRANVTIRVDPKRELPKEAWYAPRKRWRAEKLLDAIDREPPADAWKVVAVTEAKISTTKGSIEDWGIVGLGNIGSRSCVVSTFIYKKWSKTNADLM